jgi:hypothetical protein
MLMDTVASGHAQSANKTANENVGTDVESDYEQQSVSIKLGLLCGKSDQELNTKVI